MTSLVLDNTLTSLYTPGILSMSSVQFSLSVMSDSLGPHQLQHARPPSPSPTPRQTHVLWCPCPTHVHLMSVMSSNHLIFCHPLLPPSLFPNIRVFSNESVLHIRWPKYWSFRFSVSPANEYSGLIPFRIDWFDLAVQDTFKSSSVLSLFIVQLTYPYMTTGKTIVLTIQTFVDKVMSLLFNMLFRLVIAFLPRNKCLLISWLQSWSAVILEKIKSVTASTFSPSICHKVRGLDAMILVFWMLSFKPNFFTLFFHFHQEVFSFLFPFCHKGGVFCISEVIFSQQSWFQLVLHPAQHFSWCTLNIS